MSIENIEHAITEGSERLSVSLPANAAARLANYLVLLERWNRAYNLTAVRDPEAMVVRHLLDSLSMILLTVPIFLPIVLGMDYWGLSADDKAIWFGIMMLMLVEIGLITPPVGMNVYIINSLAGDVPMSTTFRGVVPFLISDGIRILLLVFVPPISLFLVRMFG